MMVVVWSVCVCGCSEAVVGFGEIFDKSTPCAGRGLSPVPGLGTPAPLTPGPALGITPARIPPRPGAEAQPPSATRRARFRELGLQSTPCFVVHPDLDAAPTASQLLVKLRRASFISTEAPGSCALSIHQSLRRRHVHQPAHHLQGWSLRGRRERSLPICLAAEALSPTH